MNKHELIEKLKSSDRDGAGQWLGRFRREHPHVLIVLEKANLFGCDLKGINFTDVCFVECQLQSANFAECGLLMAEFLRCHAKLANFTKARLVHTTLEGTDLTGAKFIDANLIGATFEKCDLSSANFLRAVLTESDRGNDDTGFKNCVLKGAGFKGTALDRDAWVPELTRLWRAAPEKLQAALMIRIAAGTLAQRWGVRKEGMKLPEHVLCGYDFPRVEEDGIVNAFSAAWATGAITPEELLATIARLQ